MKKCNTCGIIQHHVKDYFPTFPNQCKHCVKAIQELTKNRFIWKERGCDYSESQIILILEIRKKRIKKVSKSRTMGLKLRIRKRLNYIYEKTYCTRCKSWKSKNGTPEYYRKKNTYWCYDCVCKYNKKHISKSISNRLKTDHYFRFQQSIRCLVSQSIKNKGYTKKSRAQEILGCDWGTFKLHIEKQFLKGMSWDNRNEWHIDHIYPMKEAKTEEDVIRLNHYTNLRPLWAKDNLIKNAKIEEHQMKLPL